MARSRAALLESLLRRAGAGVQGTLVETFMTCGTKTCGCHVDPARRHGPHLYLKYKTPEGKSTAMYVRRTHEREIRKAVEAWSAAWGALVELSQINREELRERMRRRKDE